MFTKSERSSFKYWFAHWCAFQMTALNLHVWKPRMLFHDWYKPWMKLFFEYKTVQKYHRTHSKHHLEHLEHNGMREDKMDWLSMVVDWECSRFTKSEAQMNARETYEWYLKKEDASIKDVLNRNVRPILDNLGL